MNDNPSSRDAPDETDAAGDETLPHGRGAGGLRVLVVDASADDRRTLRLLLKRRTVKGRFSEAETAAAAVSAVRRRVPDVLLLDDGLGDADAAAVLGQLAVARGAVACPVVVLIGEGGEAGEKRGKRLTRLGAGDYLNKRETLGNPERAADTLWRAVCRARDGFRLSRRAVVYRANTLLKRRRERDALDRAEVAADQAQVARRDAESARERMAMAVTAADLGTWDWYPAGGQVHTNARLLAMLGYAAGEIEWTYSFWRDALHPDDRGRAVKDLGDHLEGRSDRYRAEVRLRTKGGGYRWILCTGRVFARDELGRPTRVAGTHQDVDARKQTELSVAEARDAAEHARRRTDDVLHSIRDAFVVLDADWRFTRVNPQAEQLFELPADKLIGRTMWDAFPAARGGPFETAMRRAMEGREPSSVLAEFVPLRRWLDARFYPAGEGGITVFFLDVTGLKQGEKRARDSDALARRRLRQLDSIYNTAPAGLAFIDRELRYVSINDRLAAMHGRRVAELVGRRITEVLDPRVLERIVPIYEHVLSRGTPHRVELTAALPGIRDDRPHTYLTEYVPVLDADGRVEGVNVVATDITDRKRAETLLQTAMRSADDARVSAERAKEIAERASSAKSEFLAVLSHELRTPLTPVLAGVQLLQQDLEGDAPAELGETLAMIRRNVELEVRLIDDLLDLTRLTRGKLALSKKRVDLNAGVRHVVDTCRGEIEEKGLDVRLELMPGTAGVLADPARLQQMLWNLVKNAVKFSDAGGAVTVRTSRRRRREVRHVLAEQDTSGPCGDGPAETSQTSQTSETSAAGDASPPAAVPLEPATPAPGADPQDWMVVCEVADEGIGIAPDMLPKVFTAFEQGGRHVTRTFGGLGLGLAISRALVLAHGGMISARSQGSGCGATFTLALPGRSLTSDNGTVAPRPPQPTDAPDRRPARVLLVEDHADTARLMARFLQRRLRVRVAVAHSVEAGLRLFANGRADEPVRAGDDVADGFDLIISDIGLPDGTGTDLLRKIAALRPEHPPAIALSGYGTEQDVRNSHDAGFREHLTKPVDLERLELTVRRVLS